MARHVEPPELRTGGPGNGETRVGPGPRYAQRVAAGFVFSTGALVLSGWLFQIPSLTRLHPSFVMMKANTAVGFMLLGAVLWLQASAPSDVRSWRARVGRVFSLLTTALGLATLAEFAFGWNLGIDEFLVTDHFAPAQTGAAGRMALNTALSFSVLGSAAALLSSRFSLRHGLSQGLALLASFVSLVSLVGYAYHVEALYQVGAITSMALHTAVLLFVASTALLVLHPNEGFLAVLTRRGPGSYIFRRQLAPLILLPLVLGWLKLWGERRGLYPTEIGTLLFGVSLVLLFLVMSWKNAVSLNRADEERRRAEGVQKLLAEAGKVIGASLNLDETLERVTGAAVPAFADWCIVHLLGEDDVPEFHAFTASGEKERQLLLEFRSRFRRYENPRSPIFEVLRSGRPRLIREVSPEALQAIGVEPELRRILETLAPRSWIVVPILVEGKCTGAMTFGMGASGRRYDEDDIPVAEELASRASMAIQNASLYRQTRRAVEEREHTLAVISHDLRNPLGAVLMSANVLKRAAGEDTQGQLIRTQADRVLRSGERMNHLIEDLLNLAKIEAGQLALNRTTLCGTEFIDEAVETMRPWAQQKRIHLEVEVRTAEFHIECDHGQLWRVLTNLLGNAIKFTPEEGHVKLCVEDHGPDEVLFRVTDSGPGIPAALQAHIFNRFWQARENAHKGAGLGLAIAKGIVEAHGGRIWVESEAGRGASFQFTVPKAGRRRNGDSGS